MREPAYRAFFASRMDPEVAGLLELRRQVYELGKASGHRIWVAEHCAPELMELSADQVQIACLRRVRETSEFICVLDGSYGASWNIAEVCVLELEIFMAAIASKSFQLFFLEPYLPDPRTGSLINAIRIARPDLASVKPQDAPTIMACIRESLESKKEKRLVGTRFSKTFPEGLDLTFLDGEFPPLRDEPPSKELIEKLVSASREGGDEPSRLVYAWMAMRHLCAVPYTDHRFAEFLPLWDAALCQWASVSAWFGLHGHHYLGRLAAVNTLVAIRQRWIAIDPSSASIQGTLGALASEYYSMAKTSRRGPQKHELLKKALANVNQVMNDRSGDVSGLFGIRGSILQELGSLRAGVRDYEAMLELRMSSGEAAGRIGEAQSELGFGYFRVGRLWSAGRLLRAGVANLDQSGREEFLVRALRKLGLFYLWTLRPWRASPVLERALAIAKALEMRGQLEQLGPLQRILRWLDPRRWGIHSGNSQS